MKLGRTTYQYASDLFLRMVGVVYIVAFHGLAVQVEGLIGSRGILPAGAFFDRVHELSEVGAFWQWPSLFWLNSSDALLVSASYAGMGLGLLLVLGFMPLVCTTVLWVLYLSFTIAGQVFYAYQWDGLLLETGLLAIVLAPPVWRSRPLRNPPASRLTVFLLHLLLFKLMFMSGYVKLASGDPAWRDLSALTYHFWTQPLPVWVSWFAAQWPEWLLKAGVAMMLAIELIVPFFIFTHRYLRYTAFTAFVLLQVGILVTGNYGFFNILSIVLCVPLLDDRVFTTREESLSAATKVRGESILRGIRWVVAVVVVSVSSLLFVSMLAGERSLPSLARAYLAAVAPFRSINPYGLFAVMTTSRPEIVIEGSHDGHDWLPYEFRYKPGDVCRTPLFATPFMPRLDWQMWFAALGAYQRNPWLVNLQVRLLEGEQVVLELLESNPFPEEPPRMIRAVLYDYTFASPDQYRRHYMWWDRNLRGLYSPVLTRQP